MEDTITLTSAEIGNLYQSESITAKGCIHLLCEIYGGESYPSQYCVAEISGMKKSTYYKALNQLKAESTVVK
jgi:hypothetical protein